MHMSDYLLYGLIISIYEIIIMTISSSIFIKQNKVIKTKDVLNLLVSFYVLNIIGLYLIRFLP